MSFDFKLSQQVFIFNACYGTRGNLYTLAKRVYKLHWKFILYTSEHRWNV